MQMGNSGTFSGGTAAGQKKSNTWIIVALSAAALLMGCCVCIGGYFAISSGWLTSIFKPIKSLEADSIRIALSENVIDERPEVLARLGRPDAFTISTQTVEGIEVVIESWRYYQFGTRIDFADGEVAWTIDIDPLPEGTFLPAWYDPREFKIGMTAAEAVQAAASASPAGAEPQVIDLASGGDDFEDSTALVGDQIVIGIYQDRVVYVETMALFPKEGA
jgi:hypothetical protein